MTLPRPHRPRTMSASSSISPVDAAERHRVGQVLDRGSAGGSGRRGRRAGSTRRRSGTSRIASRWRWSLRVAGDRRGAAERAVGLDEVDQAPVGELGDRERRAAASIVSVRSIDSSRRRPASATSLARSAARVRLVRSSSMSVARADPALDRAGLAAERHDPDRRASGTRRRGAGGGPSRRAPPRALGPRPRRLRTLRRSSSWRCSTEGKSPVAAIRPVNSNQRSFATAISAVRLGDPRSDR